MQFRMTTDYAIRILLCLADRGEVTPSTDIARIMGIPPKYLLKIVKDLRVEGFVGAEQGVHGGYYLAKAPEEISLKDIILTMEPNSFINHCLGEKEECSRNATPTCKIRTFMQNLQAMIMNELKDTTLKDLQDIT